MKLVKWLLRGMYYFCVGVHATFDDMIHTTMRKRRLRLLTNSTVCMLLVASMLLVSGCASRSAASSGADASSGTDLSSSEESSSASSSQPDVELLASATRYQEVDMQELLINIKKKSTEYQENPVFAPPAAGDIAAWKKTNADVVGWITVPNTNINYPLVYHKDNNYYLHRGYYGEQSKNGVIWLDADTRFDSKGEITSTNAVIYGHNWTNCWRPVRVGDPQDIMFGQVAAYDDAAFAKANPYIRVATQGGDHVYQIFTVFYTDVSFPYVYAELPAPKKTITMQAMLDQAIAKSEHSFGIKVNAASDKIITLSTCTRVMGAGDNQRFVVMAKKIK